MPLLEVKNLTKSFGKLEVLKGISFDLNKGEVIAIIGSSGSGKSTLLRSLNFLEKADGGSITVGGETLFDGSARDKKDDDNELRKKRLHFGLVFQSFNLFPQYNTLDNVSLALNLISKEKLRRSFAEDKRPLLSRLMALPKTLKYYRAAVKQEQSVNREKALKLIERVGLTDKVAAYPFELSGGQQQRMAIARALALEPDVLCFDEPTSALDPELTGEVLKVIRDLKNYNSTMIVVTHEMEFAREVADRIIFMYDGKIEESGTPEEVFGNPKSERTRQFISK